jgi:hypothetical protein
VHPCFHYSSSKEPCPKPECLTEALLIFVGSTIAEPELGIDEVLYMAGGYLLLSTFPEYGII